MFGIILFPQTTFDDMFNIVESVWKWSVPKIEANVPQGLYLKFTPEDN